MRTLSPETPNTATVFMPEDTRSLTLSAKNEASTTAVRGRLGGRQTRQADSWFTVGGPNLEAEVDPTVQRGWELPWSVPLPAVGRLHPAKG